MTESINFPNLGIHLKSVGQSFSVFGLDIAYYGVIIGLGFVAAIVTAALIAKKTGQKPDTYFDLGIYIIITSVIGARAYYVIFSWDRYKDNPLDIFNIREGGLAVYGGVIAAVITAFVFAKVKKLSFGLITDTCAPALLVGQIIGRWGNFFNREAFGEYTDSLFAMQLPLDAVRGSDVTEKMWNHIEEIGGVSYIQVHPMFLYESVWNLAVLLLLLWWMKYKRFNGELFLMYLFGYGAGRVWMEGMRTDPLMIPGTGIRVSQALALVLMAASAFVIWRKSVKIRKEKADGGDRTLAEKDG